jgi:hypothetical protein
VDCGHGTCSRNADGLGHTCACKAGWCAAAVDERCSVRGIGGNCAFVLSGAMNTDPSLPKGTDLNGAYAVTANVCGDKPVYQKSPVLSWLQNGPVLWWLSDSSAWVVGPNVQLGPTAPLCTGATSNAKAYLSSGEGGYCPLSPEGSGCVGKWIERDSSGSSWVPRLSLKVKASSLTQ